MNTRAQRSRQMILAAVLLAVVVGTASANTYGFLQYSPPAGWEVKARENDVVLSGVDNVNKLYCLILISRDQASSGDMAQDFASEWQAVAAASFPGAVPADISDGTLPSGLPYRTANGSGGEGAAAAYVSLVVFRSAARVQSVLIVTPTPGARQTFGAPIAAFLASLRPATPSSSASPGPRPQPRPAAADRGNFKAGGITGVWMGFKNMPLVGSYEPSPRWCVFYEDGYSFEDLPRDGLANFDRKASQADAGQAPYWGAYALEGAKGLIAKPGRKFDTAITVESRDSIKLDSDIYKRCKSVDGLRLDGSWTSYANPDDPALWQRPKGQRPYIRFTPSGRFEDGGIFAAELRTNYNSVLPVDAAGTGTYSFRDFTLILKYDDGHSREISFSALLSADASRDNSIVFIGRARFNKMR